MIRKPPSGSARGSPAVARRSDERSFVTFRFSSRAMVGNRSRISPASSGCSRAYSSIEGELPLRQRSTNSAARSSIGWRASFMSVDGSPAMNGSPVAAGQFFEDRLQAFHGANVTNAGGLLLDAQHLGHFAVGQLLE